MKIEERVYPDRRKVKLEFKLDGETRIITADIPYGVKIEKIPEKKIPGELIYHRKSKNYK